MNDLKCHKCSKLLLKTSNDFKGTISIKCPKCKEINEYKGEDNMTTNWKQLKKDYLQMIEHDDTLVYENFKHGIEKVKSILENRFFNHSIESKDLKTLVFITKNESDIKIALSN
jgi:phage FluMu protein Com